MLTIRREQEQAFQQAARSEFEQQMLEHAKKFSPELARVVGDQNMATVIRMAIERGEQYGFTNRGSVRLYLEIMLTYGSDFDTDSLLPWAGKILTDRHTDQKARAERLHSATQDYLARVAGMNDEVTVRALRRVRSLRAESFEEGGGAFDDRMLRLLRAVYPEKCEYVGQVALDALTANGKVIAGSFGLTRETGTALVIGTMFAFGHGVTSDPLYPWVGATLRDKLVQDPSARAERLHQKLNIYIDHMIDALE